MNSKNYSVIVMQFQTIDRELNRLLEVDRVAWKGSVLFRKSDTKGDLFLFWVQGSDFNVVYDLTKVIA